MRLDRVEGNPDAKVAWGSDIAAQMLRDPSNLDVTFAYADVSAQLGDNEAAVAALERMLLFNPNLPRVDLELLAEHARGLIVLSGCLGGGVQQHLLHGRTAEASSTHEAR